MEYLQVSQKLNSWRVCWSLFFSHFNSIITYCPGVKNQKANALSHEDEPSALDPLQPSTILQPNNLIWGTTWQSLLSDIQLTLVDDYLAKKLHQLLWPSQSDFQGVSLFFTVSVHPRRFHKIKTIMVVSWVTHLLQATSGSFEWAMMLNSTSIPVSHCAQIKKPWTRLGGLLQLLPTPTCPWSILSVDFIVDLPFSKNCFTFMIIMDALTKMAHFLPAQQNSQPVSVAYISSTWLPIWGALWSWPTVYFTLLAWVL